MIVALDFQTLDEALDMAMKTQAEVAGFKVGLELMTAVGPRAITAIADLGLPVFADLKLHDIPNTVERASGRVSAAGARWVTVHAAGGTAMMQAAVSGMGESGVLAVTVLTSLSADDLAATGMSMGPPGPVHRLAALAVAAGVEGIVCSPTDVASVRELVGGRLIFSPGIRLPDAGHDDQKRVATPVAAVGAGADYLVIGRTITSSVDPATTAREIAVSLAAFD
ncbi:MAG: orotidine-5'-phosphate decarboxylase [Acidimicrobiia bacterium]